VVIVFVLVSHREDRDSFVVGRLKVFMNKASRVRRRPTDLGRCRIRIGAASLFMVRSARCHRSISLRTRNATRRQRSRKPGFTGASTFRNLT
jgi:hypothetical protein